jgi:hypothetical protein
MILVNAFAFAKSATPPPDQWTHFAKLRPIPWRLLAVCAVIALVSAYAFVAMIIQYPADFLQMSAFLVIIAASAGYFGWITVRSLVSYRTRSGWPHLNGVGIGESGIAFRLTGGDADVPWDSVTSIQATVTNADNPKKANIPVLRVEYAGAAVDLNTEILGASPLMVFWAMLFYWKSPHCRSELGTTVAQQRMDGWLAEIHSSSTSATPAAS